MLQRDIDPSVKPISPTTWTTDSPEVSDASDEEPEYEVQGDEDIAEASHSQAEASDIDVDLTASMNLPEAEGDPTCRGRLEAIKLTGDPNVPRGEFTWIAEDIGPKGFVRVAHEQMFKGARVVRSLGHCAARGFRNGMARASTITDSTANSPTDRYIASQLIMVSHDTLAQYWEDLGHISFYKRVDIDQFTHV